MKQLWGEENYHTEFDDMLKEKAVTKGTKIMNVLEVLREPSVYPQLCTMLLLLLSLQLCGLSAVEYSWYPYLHPLLSAQSIRGFADEQLLLNNCERPTEWAAGRITYGLLWLKFAFLFFTPCLPCLVPSLFLFPLCHNVFLPCLSGWMILSTLLFFPFIYLFFSGLSNPFSPSPFNFSHLKQVMSPLLSPSTILLLLQWCQM